MVFKLQTFYMVILFVAVLIAMHCCFVNHVESVSQGGEIKYVEPLQPVDLHMLSQDNPRLVAEVRRRFLVTPPPPGTPYDLNMPVNEEPCQTKYIKDIFKGKRDSFFVEYGASNGELGSKTLFFERHLRWTGLLIEPDRAKITELLSQQRQAWVAPVCLSLEKAPSTIREKVVWRGHVLSDEEIYVPEVRRVQCLPIYSLLLALNRTTVDYFSLDVEGTELDILRTIPFDLVDIKVFSIEYREENKKDLQIFMMENGYEVNVDFKGPTSRYLIFVKYSWL